MNEYESNKWRKRPIVITAQRMREPFTTQTMEGEISGNAGDWLITGVLSEQYPCNDGVFRQTYEPADPPRGHDWRCECDACRWPS